MIDMKFNGRPVGRLAKAALSLFIVYALICTVLVTVGLISEYGP